MKSVVKNKKPNRSYLKGIRDALVRLEEGQKALHIQQQKMDEWMNYHKGQHDGLKRNTAIVASIISAGAVIVTKLIK